MLFRFTRLIPTVCGHAALSAERRVLTSEGLNGLLSKMKLQKLKMVVSAEKKEQAEEGKT